MPLFKRGGQKYGSESSAREKSVIPGRRLFTIATFIHFVPYWKQPLIIMSSSNKGVACMRIGVGLPSGIAGAHSQLILDWARRADAGPFSSLGVIDRLAYDSFEPLTALAAV